MVAQLGGEQVVGLLQRALDVAPGGALGQWDVLRPDPNEHGVHWPFEVGDEPPWYGTTLIHGIAGIGYVLLLLSQATGEARWADVVRQAAGTLTAWAKPDRGGLSWSETLGESDDALRCQWCRGGPGIGLFFVKAHEILGEAGYLRTAQAAGEATFNYGDVRQNPMQCHGLAGSAELFAELYRGTGDRLWLDRAHDFATCALAYRVDTPEGDSWQSDEPGHYSPSFLFGAAGTGHFVLRLRQPQAVPLLVLG